MTVVGYTTCGYGVIKVGVDYQSSVWDVVQEESLPRIGSGEMGLGDRDVKISHAGGGYTITRCLFSVWLLLEYGASTNPAVHDG